MNIVLRDVVKYIRDGSGSRLTLYVSSASEAPVRSVP